MFGLASFISIFVSVHSLWHIHSNLVHSWHYRAWLVLFWLPVFLTCSLFSNLTLPCLHGYHFDLYLFDIFGLFNNLFFFSNMFLIIWLSLFLWPFANKSPTLASNLQVLVLWQICYCQQSRSNFIGFAGSFLLDF